ncbi:MAG: DUF3098 domain-containing protein [Cytophagales bacterium]|nr:DUF3098 domain-containing protein [Cytophagales bacterium]
MEEKPRKDFEGVSGKGQVDGDQLPCFAKRNYVFMLLGVCLIGLGFGIMSMETAAYGLGFLGLVLGPVIVLLGFSIQFLAIFYRS